MNNFAHELEPLDEVVYGMALPAELADIACGDTQPEHAVQNQEMSRHLPWRRLSRIALGFGLLVTPVAAGIDMMLAVPPAQVDNVGIDNLDLTAKLHIGGATTVDGGLLGGLRRPDDIHLPGLSAGVTIRPSATDVKPLSLDGNFDTTTATALGHILSDSTVSKKEQNRVKQDVIKYYGTVGGGAAYLVAVAEMAAYTYVKRRRQACAPDCIGIDTNLADALRKDAWISKRVAGALAAVIVLPAVSAVALPNREMPVHPDPLLNGTFLRGWQITGPFSDSIQQVIGLADGYSKAEKSYYNTIEANLNKAILEHYGTATLAKDPGETRLIIAGDEQGTDGMSHIVGSVAQAMNANAILNLGDITATGTSQEAFLDRLKSYALTTLKTSAGKIPVYTTLGRHDTATVAALAKKAGITVIDGKVTDVGGVPVLGDNSPYVVQFGQASQLRDPKITLADAQAALHDRAVDAEGTALIVAGHDGEDMALLNDTTEPFQISNHDFVTQPPATKTINGQTVTKLVLGSTGGHGQDDGIGGLGNLRNPASIVMLTFEHTTGNVYETIFTSNPDTTVTIHINDLLALAPDQLKLLKTNAK